MKCKTAIVLGSDSDLPVAERAADVLRRLSLPFTVHVISAHRTPEQARDFARSASSNGYGAIIAIAGKAAHLAGVLASHTRLPVVGVPVKSSDLGGLDALLSTVQMPAGVPVACVAIDGGANAAWLAARILALGDSQLAEKLESESRAMTESVIRKNDDIISKYNK